MGLVGLVVGWQAPWWRQSSSPAADRQRPAVLAEVPAADASPSAPALVPPAAPAAAPALPTPTVVISPPPAPAAAQSAPAGPGDKVILPPPPKFEAPPPPPAPPPALLTSQAVAPSGGVWAVVIGINNYPGVGHDLRAAVADANDVNEALGRYGVPADHRLVLTETQATAGVIRSAAKWLTDHATSDATAVFFYAGHIRKVTSSTEAIVGADGGLVTDADLAGLLGPLRSRNTWIALAACYSGGFTEVLGPGRVLTAAADANHLAYENDRFNRSYLVQYMVREAMIQGAAPNTVQSAFNYARNAIAKRYPTRVPVMFDQSNGAVGLKAGAPVSPTGAPIGSGGGTRPPTSTPPTTAPPNRCFLLCID